MRLALYVIPLCTLGLAHLSPGNPTSLSPRDALPITEEEAPGYEKYNGKKPPFTWYWRHGIDRHTGKPIQPAKGSSSAVNSVQAKIERAKQEAKKAIEEGKKAKEEAKKAKEEAEKAKEEAEKAKEEAEKQVDLKGKAVASSSEGD